MKTLFSVVAFFCVAETASAQYFEGEIVYANTFKSKMPGLTDEKLSSYIGNQQEYFIKDGRYKSVMNGQVIVMQLYDRESNRIYNKKNASDTLYWLDASVNDDNPVIFEIKENAGTVLGNVCSILILQSKTGTTEFYYSRKYKLDASKFEKHQYGNWAFFCSKTGAVPLKIVVDNKQFRMESIAVAIKPSLLSDVIFTIDNNIPVKKMD